MILVKNASTIPTIQNNDSRISRIEWVDAAKGIGLIWLFIISGLSGSIVWFGICYLLRGIRLFQIWGRNTVVVAGTHYVGVFAFRALAAKTGVSQTSIYDPLALIVSVFALFCYMPICSFVSRHLPVLTKK